MGRRTRSFQSTPPPLSPPTLFPFVPPNLRLNGRLTDSEMVVAISLLRDVTVSIPVAPSLRPRQRHTGIFTEAPLDPIVRLIVSPDGFNLGLQCVLKFLIDGLPVSMLALLVSSSHFVVLVLSGERIRLLMVATVLDGCLLLGSRTG